MTVLQYKIDFALVLRVANANPNGDPLNGNRPRTSYDGIGEITDVCLKRKLRDRLQESGEAIYVQSDDRRIDEHRSLAERAKAVLGSKLGGPETVALACQAWFDVRAFGNLFAIKAAKKSKAKADVGDDSESDTGISIGIRGPVTLQSAFSIQPVEITSTQITKSVSGEGDGTKRGSDTMGMKHRVDHGIYLSFGSINPQLAERTSFSGADAAVLKAILPKLLENDASAARPEGSMEVLKLVWWQHPSKSGLCSSAKVHRSLAVDSEGNVTVTKIDGLTEEIIDGF
ncbi:type I-C CRISPR-associated protein Cas7/Csd2 [Acidisphaera sp. S103]|uniref:type I-C CRISPR-associated protein Cas7/Csd2 n=1 Tax=Acidisphaera sp. S103 TaxID=1747223 RepID=UPI00131C18A8|nr:type I-C CRISPR-associated protein Cas7/Csd2 [Acidisphaera sp. S103]